TATFGQPLTATVAVTGPSGAPVPGAGVELLDGDTVITSTALDPEGEATINFVAPAAGTHDLTARYTGDSNYTARTSSVSTLDVEASPTEITLDAPDGPVPSDELVTVTAHVAAVAPGGGIPTGAVEFRVDGGTPETVSL